MEIIKKSIKFGNSAGVILPKSWQDKKVRVELIEDSLSKRIFEIINEEDLLSEVVGIYLVGSYAREEETLESDIDFLVLTGKTNKELRRGKYEILFISKDKLEKNLEKSLYLYSMIREAKPILNEDLISQYKKRNIKLPVMKIVKNVESVLKMNREILEISKERKEKVNDGTAYSIVLRLKELFLLESFLNEKDYSNSKLLKVIESEGSKKVYMAYSRIKNGEKQKRVLNPVNLLNLIRYSEKMIERIKNKNAKKGKKN